MKRLFIWGCLGLAAMSLSARHVDIVVKPCKGDATQTLQKAIAKAEKECRKGNTVTVSLTPGAVYNVSREKALERFMPLSNTTTEEQNPNPVKHIVLMFENLNGVAFDGQGAMLYTHGEVTPWVIENCNGFTLKNLTINAADPSVAEMTVSKLLPDGFEAKVHQSSHYRFKSDSTLWWCGEGWEFRHGWTQIADTVKNYTYRIGTPTSEASRISEIEPGMLRFQYKNDPPKVHAGDIYQLRHGVRNEVAGLLLRSENVTLEDLKLEFMGNFGILGQFTRNINIYDVNCTPAPGSGRSCAGFADYFHFSGCAGLITIKNCNFYGSHDDPINVHGTHLKIVDQPAPDRLTVRFMHRETHGFMAFAPGDSLAVVDAKTLLSVLPDTVVVKNVSMISDREFELVLDRSITVPAGDIVVENITWCAAVDITGCTFRNTPTRGILVTTNRKVNISDNLFEHCPMAAILIADDAASWYESGPVRDVTIRNNVFLNCTPPQIWVAPENSIQGDECVHSGIGIFDNSFKFNDNYSFGKPKVLIKAKSADGLKMSGNSVQKGIEATVELTDCRNVEFDRF